MGLGGSRILLGKNAASLGPFDFGNEVERCGAIVYPRDKTSNEANLAIEQRGWSLATFGPLLAKL